MRSLTIKDMLLSLSLAGSCGPNLASSLVLPSAPGLSAQHSWVAWASAAPFPEDTGTQRATQFAKGHVHFLSRKYFMRI